MQNYDYKPMGGGGIVSVRGQNVGLVEKAFDGYVAKPLAPFSGSPTHFEDKEKAKEWLAALAS